MSRKSFGLSSRTLAAVLAIVISGVSATAPAAGKSVRVAGPEEKVFDSTAATCASEPLRNVPDTAPVAFRRADGEVVMLSSHYPDNFYFSGPALGSVKRTCKALLESPDKPNPESYANRQWMRSAYTPDGKRVLVLIHNEYQGWLYSPECEKAKGGDIEGAKRCFWGSITYAISEDGGRTFKEPKAPANVVAVLPYRYKPNAGKSGIATPTSIVRNPKDGLLYVLVRAYGHRGKQKPGMCAMRGEGLDPTKWTVWDGQGFNMRFADPYTTRELDPDEHVCTVVTEDEVSTLVYSTFLKKFVSIGRKGRDIFVSYSDDVIHWTPPEPFMSSPHKANWKPGDPGPTAYFGLLDPDSPSPSFDTIGKKAYLYFIRTHVEGNRTVNAKRDIMRVPLEFGAN